MVGRAALALLVIATLATFAEGCKYSRKDSTSECGVGGCRCCGGCGGGSDGAEEKCICDNYGYIDPVLLSLHKLLYRSCRRLCEARACCCDCPYKSAATRCRGGAPTTEVEDPVLRDLLIAVVKLRDCISTSIPLF